MLEVVTVATACESEVDVPSTGSEPALDGAGELGSNGLTDGLDPVPVAEELSSDAVEDMVMVFVVSKVDFHENVTVRVSVDVYEVLVSADGKLAVTVLKTVEKGSAVVWVSDSVDKISVELTETFDTVSVDVVLHDSEGI